MHASISSKLDSCNSLLTGLPDKEISKLPRMQNAATRLIVGAAKNEHMSPILQQLERLPAKFRTDFKILMLTYKALKSHSPLPPRERRHKVGKMDPSIFRPEITYGMLIIVI